ncbi:MAG: molybdopterin-dependent oxidoreductase, partial [Deltaproteobacteria bacterium]|nr:molybdopterin-dependent oxidoreductase [Deltaproteobacteria bacterium]
AFRGFGNPQAMWGLEQLIDMAAEKIGMDPLEFRSKNCRRTGDPTWIPDIPIENSELEECIRLGAERIGWNEKKYELENGPKKRVVGMAITMHCSGNYPVLLEHSSAYIKVNEDGSANLMVSPGEIGQNIYEDILVIWGDTDTTVFDVGSHASRTCYMAGNAVKGAAEKVKQQIIDRAAGLMEARADDLDIREGWVYVKGSPDKGMSVRDVAHDAIYNMHDNVCQISGSHSCESGQSPVFEAVFSEVEVDTETGEVTLLKIILAHDVGRSINPMTVEGQIEGGIVQGIGYGLTEDYILNKGSLETDNFTTYKIPSAMDLPGIEVILVEEPVKSGPYGAKSAGESPINSIAPAIANAIYDAVKVRIKDLPMTPEKILDAIKANQRQA